MNQKTFIGSCHCGHVRFEVELDPARSTSACARPCNCSICSKLRFWSVIVKPTEFRLLSGRSVLTDYRFNSDSVHHPFCKYCGVHAFAHGHHDAVGGAFFAVNLACLDNAEWSGPCAPPPARLGAPETSGVRNACSGSPRTKVPAPAAAVA